MKAKRRVLFLCTGNAARSQMAEALVRKRHPDWEAHSAGVRPAPHVHPLARRALLELGIRHDGVTKRASEFLNQPFDLVVTVCDEANEACPVWPGAGARKHQSFRDPAAATGTEEERLRVFREVRDAIARSLPDLLG